MRRMRPGDEALVKASLNKLSASSRRNRFFASIAEFSDAAVQKLVDVDPERAYPLVVLLPIDGVDTAIAGGRFVQQENSTDCSFSVLVGEPWQGQGVGRRIVESLLREASRRGLRQMYGDVLTDNMPMLRLARSLHFVALYSDQGEGVLKIVYDLPARAPRHRQSFLQKFLWKQ